MNFELNRLTHSILQALSLELKRGRLTDLKIQQLIPDPTIQQSVIAEVKQLEKQGLEQPQIATILEYIIQARKSQNTIENSVDLVASGPEAAGITNRDTSVVVSNMFRNAEKTVLIAGYAIYQGTDVFKSLAQRMEELDKLRVQMYLNLPSNDQPIDESTALRVFAKKFKQKQWPSKTHFPEIHCDVRSIAAESKDRASLHAKCIVIDDRDVFVSSANFTKRGQTKNIEIGLKLESPNLARQITLHFKKLVEEDFLKPLNL